jgi:hypothetical protein
MNDALAKILDGLFELQETIFTSVVPAEAH